MPRFVRFLKPLVPDPIWRAGWRADWHLRYLTRRGRMLPDFLIIGAQKSGTTAVHQYIMQHPAVVDPYLKEVHYFDLHYDAGPDWYQANFPLQARRWLVSDVLGRPMVTGEASPAYLFHPAVPRRIYELVPQVKLIALLRNPVQRAYSHYHHQVRLGHLSESLEQALQTEYKQLAGREDELLASEEYCARNHVKYSFLGRGLYYQQLLNWQKWFGPDQLLILRSEDYFADPQAVLSTIFAFLGLPDYTVTPLKDHSSGSYPKMSAEVRRWLEAYYAPHNARLYELLGRDMGW
ncbi:MAG: sulfotransferase domain-containing protein [Chloroflexi bacterium]|nr:sulfotransferase domain-containing protein [Chloroflexota bacterium]